MGNIKLPFIQVAGIRNWKEAELVMRAGAEYLGFPLNPPVNSEDLNEEEAAEVIQRIPPPCFGVLITYEDSADEVIRICESAGAQIAQLHGEISWSAISKIKKAAPQLALIKSLIVRPGNQTALQEKISRLSEWVDAFITDTYDPQTGAAGATGKTHDWDISRELVVRSPRPVILAGGLTPDNVGEAILQVRPEGVDAHTGLEDPRGRKDFEKIRTFVQTAKAAFTEIHSLRSSEERPDKKKGQEDTVQIPIDGTLDLHAFSPREVKDLVPEYLQECRRRGIYQVRIIHGKGTGTLRRIVQSLLEKNPNVIQYKTADLGGGGWGATELTLRKKE